MSGHQSQFRAALLDPDAPVPPGLQNGAGQPVTKRFDVYRNNVTVALTEALRTGFPVLSKLLGRQNFNRMARLFARAHPPTSPLMMHYGAEMPAFLQGFAPVSHIGYLPDIARLELALRRSYHAGDTPVFAASRLGDVAPGVLMASTLALADPVILIRSQWPLIDIWRFNTVDGAPNPRAIAQSALITRAEYDPTPHALGSADATWVQCIMRGDTLATAQDAASAIDRDFDLSPLLSLLIRHNAIADIATPKE